MNKVEQKIENAIKSFNDAMRELYGGAMSHVGGGYWTEEKRHEEAEIRAALDTEMAAAGLRKCVDSYSGKTSYSSAIGRVEFDMRGNCAMWKSRKQSDNKRNENRLWGQWSNSRY